MTGQRLVVVHPDAEVLAEAAAARLLTRILDLQSVRSPVHVVLTGGTVGIKTLAAVANSTVRHAVDWTGVHLWWGDERYLPDGDADRNETQARGALLDHLDGLPAGNVHPMPAADGEHDVDWAAEQYAAELARFAPEGSAAPVFDVVLLGMGPDAHVASLFPGHPAGTVTGRPTVGVRSSPKPPPERVSLTFEMIQASSEVWIIAAGAEKADAVSAGLAGADRATAPAAAATGTRLTLWLLDSAAASR
ncbi:6-phosphogluconolactonase [Sanguibacter gelidistatuariae]|uniref:6-phosphogluconolactonase n=1 Tax=Sanguibacter gelidistatuariae TaxID=1814289 RepID=A0A1G6T6D5_9MICO|nr:6-phosphogluconolactonase [Sanguibacter gelidistatuariae]SDD24628.1 6-phosphogluconolactonase [Sanguibacter gelidistatuariae]